MAAQNPKDPAPGLYLRSGPGSGPDPSRNAFKFVIEIKAQSICIKNDEVFQNSNVLIFFEIKVKSTLAEDHHFVMFLLDLVLDSYVTVFLQAWV